MIPASVKTSLTSLLNGVNAAYPLATAPVSTLASLQQQASSIVATIDAARLADDSLIIPPVFIEPYKFAQAITALVTIAQEETTLSQLAALAGRASVNLSNAGA